jgi:hypothetical protein
MDPQAIQRRRLIAAGAVVALIVLFALVIHSCDVSANKTALDTYAQNVDTYVGDSNALGSQLLTDLGAGSSCSGPSGIYQCVSTLANSAQAQLQHVQSLNVPTAMRLAQTNMLLTMQMRRDGLRTIAGNIEPAFATSSTQSSVQLIATGMAHLFASDVLYKGYALPEIVAALHANGIGGANGPAINGGQFLTNLGWLDKGFVAGQLGVHLPGTAPVQPPAIAVVAVGTNTMATGATNHVLSTPPQTFTISVKNSSTTSVYVIACSIAIKGSPVTGQGALNSLSPGQTTSCPVTLGAAVTVGTYKVTATVSAGPNPKNRNSETFPVDFVAAGTSVPSRSP